MTLQGLAGWPQHVKQRAASTFGLNHYSLSDCFLHKPLSLPGRTKVIAQQISTMAPLEEMQIAQLNRSIRTIKAVRRQRNVQSHQAMAD